VADYKWVKSNEIIEMINEGTFNDYGKAYLNDIFKFKY